MPTKNSNKKKRPETELPDEPAPTPPKSVRTTPIAFTDYELVHLRDLFGVLLPPVGEHTISQTLAVNENRFLVESRLWSKIESACVAVGLPVGPAAPSHVIAPTGVPPLGVFQLADSPGSDETVIEGDGEGEENSEEAEKESLFRTGEDA